MLRLFSNANYKFLEKRRVAYAATGVALVVLLGAALFWQVSRGSWLNYGVDFAGGTLLEVKFNKPVTVGQIRNVIEAAIPGTEITEFGATNEFRIRAPIFTEGNATASDQVVALLRNSMGADAFTVSRTEAVTAKVGNELQGRAALAILLSFAATLIYLAFRFEWRFGVAAVIATAHDIILTLGILSAFRMEISLTTVAAVLTIVGYSLNDTIIIFDRIRENLKRHNRKMDLLELMNRSINETLPRTILTVSTTMAAVTSLAVFGIGTIRSFGIILMIGILLGTYSSIFVASPVLYEIEKRWGEKPGTRPARQSRVAV